MEAVFVYKVQLQGFSSQHFVEPQGRGTKPNQAQHDLSDTPKEQEGYA